MKLSKEEKDLILAKRKEEEESLPQKIGTLKEDLYLVAHCEFSPGQSLMTAEQKNKFVKEIEEELSKCFLSKGTEFVCFIDKRGEEEWHDNIDIGVILDEERAKQYLENIKNIKKKKGKK